MRRALWVGICLLGCDSEPIENTFPNRTLSGHDACADGVPSTFYVGLYSSLKEGECLPGEAPYDPVITFIVDDWDYSSGTFTVGETTSSGTARVVVTDDPNEEVTGTLTIGDYDEWPTEFGWDLNIGSGGTELACHVIAEGGC